MKLLAIVALLACSLLCSCHSNGHADECEFDLSQIKERGELVVITANSSTSYFNYRGEPMGFQYEMARQFAHSLGVKLKLKVVNNPADMIDSLLAGKGDLIAYNLAMTNSGKDSLLYCGEENITHQVVVQRKTKAALTDVTQLVGKDIYVYPGQFYTRIVNLNNELGGGIHIHEVKADSISEEDLIMWVAEGKIDYTVAANDVAKINRTYYQNLDIGLVISFDQRASWAVRKTSPLLAKAADEWHRKYVNSPEFKASARRYFELNKRVSHGAILSVKDGKISYYDTLFKKYAKEIGWDWRLLAALAYTESNFNPNTISWAGACGLMQLMPNTARAMGVPLGKDRDPEESIKAAVKYIGKLQAAFAQIPTDEERIKFVLAAYNAGVGHITDAMALAEKYGRNHYVWEHHVAHYILLKSHEEFYQDPVCKNGYFRGTETYNFVRDVTERAKIYEQKIKY